MSRRQLDYCNVLVMYIINLEIFAVVLSVELKLNITDITVQPRNMNAS